MKRITFFLIYIFLSGGPILAQSAAGLFISPSENLSSPNVASITRFGDIPVSHYTGIPNIGIPLYNLKKDNFNLNLSLAYHAGGVYIDQRPGWVGLNWTLNAGGVITRKKNDLLDEQRSLEMKEYRLNRYRHVLHLGFYHDQTILKETLWHDTETMIMYAEKIHDQFSNVNDYPRRDFSPDEFSFSFGGYSGKFYLNFKGEWAVQSADPIKIEVDSDFLLYSNTPFIFNDVDNTDFRCFKGFTLTTKDGTKYYFGGNKDAIEFSTDLFRESHQEAQSWYLTKITLPNGETINFSYEEGDYITQLYRWYSSVGYASCEERRHAFSPYGEYKDDIDVNNSYNIDHSNTSAEDRLNATIIRPVYLRYIITDNLKITFSRSPTNDLDFGNGLFEKESYASYIYFMGTYPNAKHKVDSYRNILEEAFNNNKIRAYRTTSIGSSIPSISVRWYKLDKILIENLDQSYTRTIDLVYTDKKNQRLTLDEVSISGEGTYRMIYNNVQQLPPYFSGRNDHWGFFNNKYDYFESAEELYQSREPDAKYLQYGILKKIQYPTGGYTEFEYEPHDYRYVTKTERWEGLEPMFSENKPAGGLRIKRIKNSDTYSGSAKTVKEYFYVSDFLDKKENAQISSGILGGRFVYGTTTNINLVGDVAENVNGVPVTRCRRYTADIRNMSIIQSSSLLPSCNNIAGAHVGYSHVVELNPDYSFSLYKYSNMDNSKYLDQCFISFHNDLKFLYSAVSTREMERGNLLSRKDYNNQHKQIREVSYEYESDDVTGPNDYLAEDHGYGPTFIRMISIKPLLLPSALHYAKYYCNTNSLASYYLFTYTNRIKSEKTTYYDPNTGLATNGEVINYNFYIDTNAYDGRHKLPRSISIKNSQQGTKVVSYKYPFDNPVGVYAEMISKNMFSTIETTTTNNGQKISVIKNNYHKDATKTKDLILAKDVETAYQGSNTFNKEITYDLYNSKGKLQQYTDKSGIPVTYLWSYLGQYPVAEIKGATYKQVEVALGGEAEVNRIKNSSSLSDSDISKLKSLSNNISLPNALISIYTHRPLVGITTFTDPSGLTTNYEYDSFGRFIQIKDHDNKTIEEHKYTY